MPKFPHKGAKMQAVANSPRKAANDELYKSAIADLVTMLDQAEAESLHGAISVEISAKGGRLDAHCSNVRRDRRNLTNPGKLAQNDKQLNSARKQIAVFKFREMVAMMIETEFVGTLAIEVLARNGRFSVPSTVLKQFHNN